MKNFFLYAGYGRAGSTWLYGELNARGDCEFSHIKEHFLFVDFTLNPEFDKSNFFDLYETLAENPEVKLLGEISPSNAYATVDQLLWFKSEAEKRNFNVLPVMTLRDPVDQVASVMKLVENTNVVRSMVNNEDELRKTMRNMRMGVIPRPNIEITFDIVKRNLDNTPFSEIEVPWRETYNNFKQVFGKIHVNLFETLFTPTSMNMLCDYLEIPMSDFNYDVVKNKQGKSAVLTDDEKQYIFDNGKNFSENYQFAVDIFGKDNIESVWWTPNK